MPIQAGRSLAGVSPHSHFHSPPIQAQRFQFSCLSASRRFPPSYRAREFVVMLIQAHIAVQQRRRAVNPLSGGLILHGDNVAVPVCLYARVGQAPFQDRVIILWGGDELLQSRHYRLVACLRLRQAGAFAVAYSILHRSASSCPHGTLLKRNILKPPKTP